MLRTSCVCFGLLVGLLQGWVACGPTVIQPEPGKEAAADAGSKISDGASFDDSAPREPSASEGQRTDETGNATEAALESTPEPLLEGKPEVPTRAAGTWSDAPALPFKYQETAVVALRGEIYVLGGINGSIQTLSKVLVYNPKQKKWREAASLPKVMHHANAAVYNGKIYVLGSLNPTFGAQGGVYSYDPDLNKWTTLKPMARDRMRGSSAVGTIGDTIYVMGGLRRTALVDCDAYEPKTDTWTRLPNLPVQLDHMAAGVIDGKLYVAGGRNQRITKFESKSFVFDPKARTWSEIAPIPTLRGGVAAAVFQGKLYVIGGEGNPASGSLGVFNQVEVYDPKSNQWAGLAAMPQPVHGTGAATVEGTIYVPGGATRQAFGATDLFATFKP